MKNYILELCYDGTRYRGWQKQGNTPNTIQAKVETILSAIMGESIEISGSGRTDAGVHANRQVCSFHAKGDMKPEIILQKLREHLPEDVGALGISEAEPRFHARLSCREKSYLYRIWNSSEPNVFQRKYMLSWPGKLDLDAMDNAAKLLLGRHDFSSFCSNKRMKKSAVRELRSIDITRDGNSINIMLTGDGFLYNMVRIIVGTLLEVGSGKQTAENMPAVLAACDRQQAGFTVPAHGLTLWDELY